METIRLSLIFLHTVIMIFATVRLHPHFNHIADDKDSHKRISGMVGYTTDLLCIVLYHTSSILAVWFSRRSGAGIVRASGVLLIGELLHVMASVIQHVMNPDLTMNGELMSSIAHDALLVVAVILTFRMSEQIAKRRADFMQIELLPNTMDNREVDNSIEPAFL